MKIGDKIILTSLKTKKSLTGFLKELPEIDKKLVLYQSPQSNIINSYIAKVKSISPLKLQSYTDTYEVQIITT